MTHQNNAAQPGQDPIYDAIFILTEEADSLSECHTRTPGDWAGEPEAKARYDHILAVVDALSKLRAPVADERAAFEAKFPLPAHCQWIGNGYAATEYNAWDASKHASRWEGWKACAALASAPIAKPKRAPTDDWRVQAIAECLEAEWDDTTPDQAEADARLIVGYLIEYEKESDRIEAKHAADPVEPIVQAIRNLRASAPVAGEAAYYAVMHGQALYGIFDSEAAAVACKGQGHPDAPFSVKPLYAAPQASAEYERGHSDGWAAGWDQAQADKDGGDCAKDAGDVPSHLLDRLRHHAADKANTAFARSTMNELAGYLDPTQPSKDGGANG